MEVISSNLRWTVHVPACFVNKHFLILSYSSSPQRAGTRRRYHDDGISDEEIDGKKLFDLEEKISSRRFGSDLIVRMEGKGGHTWWALGLWEHEPFLSQKNQNLVFIPQKCGQKLHLTRHNDVQFHLMRHTVIKPTESCFVDIGTSLQCWCATDT